VQELGESIARQIATQANGNILYHKHHAQFMNGIGRGKKAIGSSVFWEFKLFWEFGPLQKLCEICKNPGDP